MCVLANLEYLSIVFSAVLWADALGNYYRYYYYYKICCLELMNAAVLNGVFA